MGKKIDVIIPCYNTHKTLPALFGSIMEQTVAEDIHVIMVDDCSDETYDELIKPFQEILDIELIRCDVNGGPAVARRIGQQAGKCPYLTFIDSDDTFFSCFSVQVLYDRMVETKCDIVYSDFLEDCGKGRFVTHPNDHVWMFGKMFRKEFLDNLEITFNNTRSNEDSGFNHLTRYFAQPEYVEQITYVWHYQPNSITRKKNGLYGFTCSEGHIFNKIWAVKEAAKRGVARKMYVKDILGQLFFYFFDYFNIKKNTREEVDPELYKQWVARYYKAFKKEIDDAIAKDKLESSYKENFIGYFNNFDNITIPDLTFVEFIDMLDKVEFDENAEWGQK